MDRGSLFSGNNAPFLEALYQSYLEDPNSVDPNWAALFAELDAKAKPAPAGPKPLPVPPSRPAPAPKAPLTRNGAAAEATSELQLLLNERLAQMIDAYRLRGHLAARLDPLERPRNVNAPTLDPQFYGFTEAHMGQIFHADSLFDPPAAPLHEILRRLRTTYCQSIGVEYLHISEPEPRIWLQHEMERCENIGSFTPEDQLRLLTQLSYAEGFEQFLHTKYVGAKRFSVLGEESIIPTLHALLEEAGEQGIREIVIGMAHRGRLNVLVNIMGKPFTDMFSEFEKNPDPWSSVGSGDVKYHMGFSSDHVTQKGHPIHISLAFNPSHLEAIDPVTLGRVRAKQDRQNDPERNKGMALLLHGDAAFAGQGMVPETLNLASLPGYNTGGTIHIVLNNQIGFTTYPEDSRSTYYATDVAHMLKIPIFHVNADDVEAAVYVARLAMRFRQKFHKSVVIDLIGYRRYGHNESDEPTFTQPQMYELIRKHPSVRQKYAEKLIAQGRITAAQSEEIARRCMDEFQRALDETRAHPQIKKLSSLGGLWAGYKGGPDADVPEVETGVDRGTLEAILTRISQHPPDFNLHPKLRRFLSARAEMARGERPIDWSTGEALGIGSLLWEGTNVRFSGQDSRRGTFSQRHAVLTDVQNETRYTPLAHLKEGQGQFTILDSPLSEAGVLGFEFGYSLDMPDALVIWEAQFGDFVNNAQVVLDQFISSAEDKWRRLSGLTLFLPHGYEGQGPEHSSARMERFLQLCAEDNLQITNPTTPAQLFHLLRRQVVRPYRKPLVVFTPKSLLRHPDVVSPLEDFTHGTFQRVLPDPSGPEPALVQRLILCTGKVFYDLFEERKKQSNNHTALVRVEQLYPFPEKQLSEILARYPNLTELFWLQEEPENMGAWTFMAPRLAALTNGRLRPRFIGREASASPATGSYDTHILEQAMLTAAAFSTDPDRAPSPGTLVS